MTHRVVTIVGARPQFVKAAAVSRALRECAELEEVIVHSGQHYDDRMSDLFFKELAIPVPRFNLGVGSASHGAQTGRMLERIEQVLFDVDPDFVLVYGDTNTTMAGALAATKLHIPVGHVEAGLRSFDRDMPEEINRVVTDHVSAMLFAPTSRAVTHLLREGVDRNQIHLVGDVMYDVSRYYRERALSDSTILQQIGVKPRHYVLATIHRAENTDDVERLAAILRGFKEFSAVMPVFMPLHPRTREVIDRNPSLAADARGLKLMAPVGYLDMTALEANAALIATDSGGVQKEAFFHRVPCVTLRDETEWTELVDSGWNRLCSPQSGREVGDALRSALGSRGDETVEPYGDGHAALHVVNCVASFLQL